MTNEPIFVPTFRVGQMVRIRAVPDAPPIRVDAVSPYIDMIEAGGIAGWGWANAFELAEPDPLQEQIDLLFGKTA